ncbi:tripartite tricarboxylate transporter TctB family protein [Zestomonas carbonaria]|uniref:DUF1468 domain-containing protein n=1 Tax=Zestomonas carbonaria TaxID=2762745 RepID=A0A7U7ERW3_9GAMM|nr:tripartite tricarboxylate transporter TctB family protein [Pseudomonas carbonaria]CAD5109100.1 hypothetical protein PSEWESI4_03396 [Pseudomonas carbonaria]
MYQRLFAGALLLACIGLGVIAWDYHAPFSYEPVGPRAYPILLLGLLGAGLLYLMFKQPAAAEGHGEELPLSAAVIRKVVICLVFMLAYAGLFEILGFIPASLLFGIAMSRLYDGRWLPSLVAGVALAIGLYLLFDKALDVPLPLGILSALEN